MAYHSVLKSPRSPLFKGGLGGILLGVTTVVPMGTLEAHGISA
jgi:hypothetical protein